MANHVDPKVAEATGTAILKIEDITIDKAPTIFGKNDLHRFVELVRAAVIGEVPDLTTDKGRKRVASLAASVARSKTAVDGVGRAYLKELKGLPKVIEGELREFGTAMDALRDEVRKPLNDLEAADLKRRDAIEDAVQAIIDLHTLPEDCDSAAIRLRYAQMENRIPKAEVFQERLEEANEKRKYGLSVLSEALTKRVKFEAEAEELERLRKEKAERAEKDRIEEAARKAVEDERQRAAQQQQAQREADARRVQEAEQKAEQAERDRIAAEQRAETERKQSEQRAEKARLDEQERQQRAAEAILQQQQAREANRAHCGAINKAALEALLAVNVGADSDFPVHLSEVEGKAIIAAIIRGQIPAVSIAY